MCEILARVRRIFGGNRGVVCSIVANKFSLSVSFGG
jgi:hypothetical protein